MEKIYLAFLFSLIITYSNAQYSNANDSLSCLLNTKRVVDPNNLKNELEFSDNHLKSLKLSAESVNIGSKASYLSTDHYSKDETPYNIYSKRNQFKNSLRAFINERTSNARVINDTKTAKIGRPETQPRFNKKQDSIEIAYYRKQALSDEIIKQDNIVKNWILAGSYVVFFFAIAVFIIYKQKRDAVEKKYESELKTQAMDTEMKALRAQMNPHFIFNSLNSIKNYIDKNDTEKASLYTSKFAKLTRMILENSEKKEITIAQDLKALELYMQLESLRMKDKFIYEITVDEAIDQENTLIPPLILQPFVENSIWHGISQREADGKIWIYIKKEGKMIDFIVEDNGIGINEHADDEPKVLADKKSLGMKITQSRIDIMNRMKKVNASVSFSNLNQGTKIEVRLPEALVF